jgi:hypothetical protein
MEETRERENNKLQTKLPGEKAKSDGRSNALQELAAMGTMTNPHMANNAVFVWSDRVELVGLAVD